MRVERVGDVGVLRATGVPELRPNVAATTTVIDAATEATLAVIARFPPDRLADYRRAALAYPPSTSTRMGVLRNTARTFGFTARNALLQNNTCHACSGASAAPRDHATLAGAAGVLIDLLAEIAPDEAERARAAVLPHVLPDWRMAERAPWTSGVLNFTSALPYHFDTNNFDAWSAMVVARRNVDGGHLSIPEYGLVVECRDGDVVFFNGSRLMHGVTPMRRTKPNGYRLTAVYYPVRKMGNCLPANEEVADARRRRSRVEDDLIERQRAVGFIR